MRHACVAHSLPAPLPQMLRFRPWCERLLGTPHMDELLLRLRHGLTLVQCVRAPRRLCMAPRLDACRWQLWGRGGSGPGSARAARAEPATACHERQRRPPCPSRCPQLVRLCGGHGGRRAG